MSKPELRQANTLGPDDFDRCPLWIGVHIADVGQPWYEECDEETYRPWPEPFPVSPSDKMLLVAATFQTRAGTEFPGFFSPVGEDWDVAPTRHTKDGKTVRIRTFSERQGGSPLAILQLHHPRMFVSGRPFTFWGGRRGIPVETRQNFCEALGNTAEKIFPIRFEAKAGLVNGIVRGELHGFYRSVTGQPPEIGT